MRTSYIIVAIGIVLLVVFLTVCVQKITQDKPFKIISKINYDRYLCGRRSSYHNHEGFYTGLRAVLKDKDTGENLEGNSYISIEGGGGGLSLHESYSCEEQISSQNAIVSVYSKGYTPMIFELDLPKNQLATVEVSMMKSCSGGPTCFDNLKVGLLERVDGNQTKAEEIITSSQNWFFDIIKRNFGLEKSDYELSCMECDMMRQPGYIKAKGTYKDGSPFELYYHWDWCSPAGTGCGWDICFSSTSNTLFESVKTNICSKISSGQSHDEYSCTAEAYDDTEQVKSQCLAGEYERIVGNEKTLAIKQISNRCKSSVEEGNFDYIGN